MKTSMRILALAILTALPAVPALAQPDCTGLNEHLMSWPTVDPVWEFCWLRPSDSSAPNGSGLEIRNVYYNGYQVMKRGHMPILNVEYLPGGCGCFRDWLFEEVVFQSDNVLSPGYSEPTVPPVTVCEAGGTGGDVGSFEGVAAEKLADRLILTTQNQAGWYRYIMRWTFYLDGRIQPSMGYSAVNDSCIAFGHRHHGYWRFDFDIDGPANDLVAEGPNPAPPGGRPGPRYPVVQFPTEAMRRANRPDIAWTVADSGTHRGYRIVPGEEVNLPADTFSVGDVWLLRYKAAGELDDQGQTGPACAIKFNSFVDGETTSPDLVFWYRGGAFHAAGDLDNCHLVGPTLYPIGNWSIPGPH